MLELWYAALDTTYGLRVRSDSRDKLKMKLYAARRSAGDPVMDDFSIICPAHEPDQLWLIRKVADGQA